MLLADTWLDGSPSRNPTGYLSRTTSRLDLPRRYARGHKFVEPVDKDAPARRDRSRGCGDGGRRHRRRAVVRRRTASRAPELKPKPILQERKVGKFGEVLTNSAGHSLYLLTSEANGKLHCTSSTCLGYWPPLYVAKDAMITAASGIKGKISHVTRGSRWQVTYNGWPVYTFGGDSGPGQSKGEDVVAGPGATWYLVNAAEQELCHRFEAGRKRWDDHHNLGVRLLGQVRESASPPDHNY